MAITNATKLADFGSGIGTAGSVLEVDNDNDRIGIGTSNPNATLTAGAVGAAGTTLFVYGDARCLGVITATSFDDGSGGPIAGINTTGLSTFTQVVTSGITSVINTTAATSSSTGALIISGGVGIAKSLYVDGGISPSEAARTVFGHKNYSLGGVRVRHDSMHGGIHYLNQVIYFDLHQRFDTSNSWSPHWGWVYPHMVYGAPVF